MHPCSRCHRHVLVTARQCPFCGAPQRDVATSVGGFAGVLLGLTLAACGDDTEPDTTGASTTVTTSTSASSTETASTTGGESSTTDVSGAEVADYGGSGPFEDTGPLEATADSSSGDSTGTDSGSSTTDNGASEGADYGGAAPRD